MDLGIKGKTALVTASSKGIGKAVADGLAAEGCRVAICARGKDELMATAAELKRKYNTDAFWCVCDLNKAKDIENVIEGVQKSFGPIEILINNCGGPAPGFFLDLNEDDWSFAYDQVLMSAIRTTKLVIPSMLKNEWGRVINITSVAVKQPVENLLLSNTFRAGLTGFSKSLSNEVSKYNITINNVAPGYTLTHRLYELAVTRARISGKSHEEMLAEMAKLIPANRLGMPEEIAAAVLFFSSKQASYITGQTLLVDGGNYKGIM
ncbi:MAG: SDR family oxidoreductase [Ignavibacteriaceae bacterium]|nr:SDR family oxidoreductase [Ignavibacteriaceae bacterium]